jgi:hypothetical protein
MMPVMHAEQKIANPPMLGTLAVGHVQVADAALLRVGALLAAPTLIPIMVIVLLPKFTSRLAAALAGVGVKTATEAGRQTTCENL